MTEVAEQQSKHRKEAQASMQDLIKLLISLASGVLGLSGTFVSQLTTNMDWFMLVLLCSWVALSLSIYFGIVTLSSLASYINNETATWWSQTLPKARKCWYSFQVGIAFLLVYGVCFGIIKSMEPEKPTLCCACPAMDETMQR